MRNANESVKAFHNIPFAARDDQRGGRRRKRLYTYALRDAGQTRIEADIKVEVAWIHVCVVKTYNSNNNLNNDNNKVNKIRTNNFPLIYFRNTLAD